MCDHHDDIIQHIKESDEHLSQVNERVSLRVTEFDQANAEDSHNAIRKLSERLANVGINPSRARTPKQSDANYEPNHQDHPCFCQSL